MTAPGAPRRRPLVLMVVLAALAGYALRRATAESTGSYDPAA